MPAILPKATLPAVPLNTSEELEASGMNGLVEENNPEKEDVALHSDFGSIDSEGNFTAGQNKKK